MIITDFIKNNFLILDGAMGTMLQSKIDLKNILPETLNITHPEIIQSIHKEYVQNGSDLVLTCTFGANAKKLADSEYSVNEIIGAAINNAKMSGAKYIGLDIGPIGELLAPTGTLSFEEAYEIFKEIIDSAKNKNIDVIYIETMTDLLECKAAILAAKENCNIPIFCTMTFEKNGRTFLGVSPEIAATTLTGLGVDAIGINCSLNPNELLEISKKMSQYTNLPLIIKANAGLPCTNTSKLSYNITPEEYALQLEEYINLGFNIYGGCCGTDPKYILEIKKMLTTKDLISRTYIPKTIVCSSSKLVIAENIPIIIGERINPTGKKRFKEALINNDIGYIINQGIEQVDAGSDILDVNVGHPDIDECEMMYKISTELQSILDTPLQLDSSNPAVLEKSLRTYNGIPIINSVNGKQSSMDEIFPIISKYGAVVVALTLDENGIPDTAQGRYEIAKKIINEAQKYNIPKEKIIIDCLTLTISAEPNSAKETLKAMNLVKENLHVKTALGVSNISFGLPNRELINSNFLMLAFENGLDFAIINPNSKHMMNTFYSYKALFNLSDGVSDYIKNFSDFNPNQETAVINKSEYDINYVILNGLDHECKKIVNNLLLEKNELDIITQYLIPALDIVGDLYEKNKIFLPQLIRASETAKIGFDIIKDKISSNNSTVNDNNEKIVLATVHGDIHDIGKNIVKVVLENYGYNIIDLGKDVPSTKIVEATQKYDVKLVGLSALMTTTLPSMKETIELLKNSNFKGKIMVGGAVLSEEYANKINADFYAKDIKASIDIVKNIF